MHVRTSVGSGVKHVVQHGIMVHVKPVSDVSQSVRATQIRQVQVKENRRQITISVTWQRFSWYIFVPCSFQGYKVFSVSMKITFPPKYPSSPGN